MLDNYSEILQQSLSTLLPVWVLSIGLVCALVFELFRVNGIAKWVYFVSNLVALIAILYSNLGSAFFEMVKVTPFAQGGMNLVIVSSLLVGLIHLTGKNIPDKFEYFALLFGVEIGALLLMVSTNYVMFYVALEMVSLCSYALVYFGVEREKEAAIKYLIFGALTSAMMLFGISILYGLSGTLDIFVSLKSLDVQNVVLALPILLFLAGTLFKIGVFPFHFWLPEVYKSISYDLIAFFSTVPKIAVTVFLYSWVNDFNWLILGGVSIAELIAVLAIITLTIGNLTALSQNSIKGIIAYASIANVAYILMPLLIGDEMSASTLLFYWITYVIAIIGLCQMCELMNINKLSGLDGVGKKNVLLGFGIGVMILSLIGIPPVVGFSGKLVVFINFWNSTLFGSSSILKILFFYAIMNTVVALFYYLKFPYRMFFKVNESSFGGITLVSKIIVVVFSFGTIYMFFAVDYILMLFK
ncbi:MAG: NADH-quinone oxidoreductase subunit N [Saprospiraceae bacterium]|nr:NADH-quinone oxidoreductase subunit N [Saprospiraceae bacterium]